MSQDMEQNEQTNKQTKNQFHQIPSSLQNTQWCSLSFWLPQPVTTMATPNINYEPKKNYNYFVSFVLII